MGTHEQGSGTGTGPDGRDTAPSDETATEKVGLPVEDGDLVAPDEASAVSGASEGGADLAEDRPQVMPEMPDSDTRHEAEMDEPQSPETHREAVVPAADTVVDVSDEASEPEPETVAATGIDADADVSDGTKPAEDDTPEEIEGAASTSEDADDRVSVEADAGGEEAGLADAVDAALNELETVSTGTDGSEELAAGEADVSREDGDLAQAVEAALFSADEFVTEPLAAMDGSASKEVDSPGASEDQPDLDETSPVTAEPQLEDANPAGEVPFVADRDTVPGSDAIEGIGADAGLADPDLPHDDVASREGAQASDDPPATATADAAASSELDRWVPSAEPVADSVAASGAGPDGVGPSDDVGVEIAEAVEAELEAGIGGLVSGAAGGEISSETVIARAAQDTDAEPDASAEPRDLSTEAQDDAAGSVDPEEGFVPASDRATADEALSDEAAELPLTSVPAVGTVPDGLPPVAPVQPTERIVHGVALEDPYAWLRAENWREVMRDPSVLPAPIRAYLEAENANAAAVMAPTDMLRHTLVAELRGRIKEDDASVPEPDGEFAYAMRYAAGAEHPRLVRTTRHGRMERVLLDLEHEAVGHTYFRLGAASHSPNHRWLAWASDVTGGEEFEIRIRDTAREIDLTDRIERTSGSLAWASDNETVLYVRLDADHRPASVWRHRRGTPAEEDVLVYEETDPGFFVGVSRSLCGRFVMIDVHDHETSEWRLIPADRPDAEPRIVAERVTGVEYEPAPHGSSLFILTNAGLAEDFRIVRAPLSSGGHGDWVDAVPHRPGCLIVSMIVFDAFMVRLEREDGLPRIVVRRLSDGNEHAIAFEEEAYALGLSEGYEFDTQTLRFTYASMTTPSQVIDYDLETRERTLRKTQEIPSGHDPADYVTRRIQAPTVDGETVPVSLLHRADTPIDGTAPCLLYGYGAYGITIPASFNANALSLVDRGFVFAIAHVRGGKDKGFRWYREGRREHKTNTFTDFLAAADHLVAENFTARGRIVAQGGSAGGMLMGVVANDGENRFAGIIAEVPFVDVLNTMLDPSLPLTPPEWPEWGNPIEDAAAFERIRSYSPYDNVSAQDYPALLALAGVSDPRVTYWEPAKWVARLRALRTNDAPLALKTNMGAGHGGASGRFARLEEVAFSQSFALMVTGSALR